MRTRRQHKTTDPGANLQPQGLKTLIENADAMLLDAAAKGDSARVRSLLLHSGAEVDVRNSKGETALILAAAGGHMDVVQILKNAHADPFALGQDNLTASGRAKEAGYDRVASALKAYEGVCTKECAELETFNSD
jgi:ankyrin repeat protein